MEAQPKCNLIIDSCCDLPFEVIDRPGVQLLEFPSIDEKGEHSDDLYRTITPHEFYEGMRAGSQPSTAQVPVTVFQDVFSKAIESGVPTVYLSFTSGLSGSFNTAVMMRDQLIAEHPEAELYVVATTYSSASGCSAINWSRIITAVLKLPERPLVKLRYTVGTPLSMAFENTSWNTVTGTCAVDGCEPARIPS